MLHKTWRGYHLISHYLNNMLTTARHLITQRNSGREERRRGIGRAPEKTKFLDSSIIPEALKNYLATIFKTIKKKLNQTYLS